MRVIFLSVGILPNSEFSILIMTEDGDTMVDMDRNNTEFSYSYCQSLPRAPTRQGLRRCAAHGQEMRRLSIWILITCIFMKYLA